MNTTAIVLLKEMIDGNNDKKRLMEAAQVKAWQFNYIVNDLIQNDYVTGSDSQLHLSNSVKSILFRDIARKYDVIKLLRDSNELILACLVEPLSVEELKQKSSLSRATIYRALSDLESIGTISRKNDKMSLIRENSDSLYLFAKILLNEKKRDDIKSEDFTEIVYQDNSLILKKVPNDEKAQGELTAFSLFSEYGIDYYTNHDYYAEQVIDLTIEQVLIHAILIASENNDINGIIMCILFYIKNKNKMDLLEIKRYARKLNVIDVWLDIENFLRHNPISKTKLFPPWNEFESKANLYDIPKKLYDIPSTYPNLFKELSKNIDSDIKIFLIGGENMRIKGLKGRTKDCDIVIDNDTSFNVLKKALVKLGYITKDRKNFSKDESRVEPFEKFSHINDSSDIEIFNSVIARKLYLSEKMKQRSKEEIFSGRHKLRLYLLANEDIFLLKAVTDREGDLYDMTKLIQDSNFHWNIVWDEIERQENDTGYHFSSIILNTFENLVLSSNIKPPIFNKLVQRALDENICKLIVKNNGMLLDQLISWLEGSDVSERRIRSRIDSLHRKELIRIRKYQPYRVKGNINRTFVQPRKALLIRFKERNDLLDKKYYVNYNSVIQHIERLSKAFNVYDKVFDTAKGIAEKVCIDPIFIANRPRNLAGAILYMTFVMDGINRTQKDISDGLGLSPLAIPKLIKKIKQRTQIFRLQS